MMQDLGLELGLELGLGFEPKAVVPHAKGRMAAQVECSFLREIEPGDLLDLGGGGWGELGSETPSLQKLKHSHHNLARLLAQGLPAAEVSLVTGYSASRISILQHDPAFAELIVYYAEQVEEVFVNVHERLAAVGMDALQELQDRLESEGEGFSVKELLDTIGITLDRSGFGPKSIVQHDLGGGVHELLEVIKKEVDSRQNGNIKTLVTQKHAPAGGGASVGRTIELKAEQHSERAAEGKQGIGPGIREEGGEDASD